MEVVSSTIVTARKEHTCDWCSEKIKVGSKYEKSFLKDGDVWTWKNHIHCSEIARKLKMFDGGPVDEYYFKETVDEEYMRIMIKNPIEIYKSDSFKMPSFGEQLEFVCKFHNVSFNCL